MAEKKEKSFSSQMKSGLVYTAMAKYSGIVVSLLISSVLARLLPPAAFGVIAIATVFIVFFSIFSDMGLSSAIIQKRDLTKEDYTNLFSLTVYSGLILGGLFFLCSWLISRFYKDPQLIGICQMLSLNIVFATWNIVPNGLLLRDKEFKFIGIRTISIQIVLGIISIIAAYCGAGVYALLINPILGSFLIFLLNYYKQPVSFSLSPQFSSLKKVASYSVYTFGFSLINYFTRNLDKLLVGRVFGLAPLGYYEKSYRLMMLPVQNLASVITPVLHPVLADYQNDLKSQIDKYLKLMKMLALIGMPVSAFLYFSADQLVLIIFGNQWLPSVPVFKILSLSVGLQIVGSTAGALYQAINRTKAMFILGVSNTIINVAGLLIGVYVLKSIEGVAWMWVATLYIGLWNNIVLAKCAGISVMKTFEPYLPSIIPTAIVAILAYSVSLFGIGNMLVSLLLNVLILMVVLASSCQYYNIFNIKGYILKRFKHG